VNAQANQVAHEAAKPAASHTRITVALLLIVLLLAMGLRLYRLDAQSLWNDEGTSVAIAQRDLATIARDAASDIHPPLYYWLLSGWTRLFGTSEAAVRLLSVVLGVALVALTFALGRTLAGAWVGLIAAFLAAINPFQVAYSQEARMYMLVALLAAGAVWALARYVRSPSWPNLLALVLLEVAGLYTHYSFLFIILVLNLSFLAQLRRGSALRRLWPWIASQAAVVVLYSPWLPTAVRQVTTWPSPAQDTALLPALASTWRWLVFGPSIETGQVAVPLVLAALVALLGTLSLAAGWIRHARSPGAWTAVLLSLWLGLPVLFMFALGLYREAYLKFLLVTTPALTLLLAAGLRAQVAGRKAQSPVPNTRYPLLLFQTAALVALLIGTTLSLRNYYTDPTYARDDYRSIAAYVGAVGRPGDAILLNAPGQQEVFGYYYQGDVPVHALPESRPLNPASTELALGALAHPGGRVFTVLWATDESDPERFVEGWLDRHAFKSLDSWYGNVRLVIYAVPDQTPVAPTRVLDIPFTNDETGDQITLAGYNLLNPRLGAGDIAQVTLFWQADQTPTQRYKVFLHLLDGADHIVGQRDAEPGGGALLTTLWPPGETIADNYGLPVHSATPPGEYRLEIGMYDADTGQRLRTSEGSDRIELEMLEVVRPAAPAPIEALGMQHRADVSLGDLTLLGYDAHRLGFDHQPETLLTAGNVLHVNLYWRAEAQPGSDWQVAIRLIDADEREWAGIVGEPVEGYPTSRWQPGDVWRGQYNLSIPGDAPAGHYRLWIQPLEPGGVTDEPFLSDSIRVGSAGE
jgi:4-amino-4-deoxy-L-arabinose transferase-like glycosyltransferase